MDLQCGTFEFGSSAKGIGYLISLSLQVDELEPVPLHFLDPASLTVRQMGRRVLEQVLEWCMIGSQDKIPITQLKPPSLRHCHYHCQPFPICRVVSGLGRQELPAPESHWSPLGAVLIILL